MFPSDVVAFRKAIYDQIKLANPGGSYIPTTASLRAAGFTAMKELIESEDAGAITPMHAVNVWNAVMLCNESAFRQRMADHIKSGELTDIKLVSGAKAVAKGYFE